MVVLFNEDVLLKGFVYIKDVQDLREASDLYLNKLVIFPEVRFRH